MLEGGAQDEAGVRQRFELNRAIVLLEYGEFARRYPLRRRHVPLVRRDPGDVMPLRRTEGPAFPGLQPDIEVGHAVWRPDDAFHAVVFACDDPRGTRGMEVGGTEILALGFGKLEFGRHGDPELKALDPLRAEHPAGMPDAAAGAHPLDTAGVDDAFAAGSLLVKGLSGNDEGQRRDSGMRMKSELRCRRRIGLEVVEKHERLDLLADVTRADQPGKATVRVSTRAKGNLS